jgi:hypothetical protein
MRTKPGFEMESQMFSLKFMSASQQGQLSHLLEYETDWKEMMKIMLTSTQEGGDELELKVGVIISEKKYNQSDSLKCLRLIFNDLFKTVVLFNVRKKKVMKTLKMISAEMISSRHLTQEEEGCTDDE